MDRKLLRLAAILCTVCLLVACAAGCNNTEDDPSASTNEPTAEFIDYAGSITLDMSSETAKQSVTVSQHVDGDTVHFNVPTSLVGTEVLKARFLAVDTPESTGKVEPYGKAASNFTKEKLASATSIVIESDDENWNADSTAGRYLVWVWYRTSEDEEYRNLNVELLQNGLAAFMNSGNNRYGETCTAALAQAQTFTLNMYSGEEDPDYYYGDAYELTMKELRANVADYVGLVVAFEGVVVENSDNALYIEEYDSETDMYNGMYIYYGYGLNADGKTILSVGNRVRIVGTVSLYSGSYQVSGLSYKSMQPDDPSNIQLISSGHEAAYQEVSAETFVNGTVMVELGDEGEKEYAFAEMALGSSISIHNLTVKSIYTTSSDTSSNGAMTLTCESDGLTVYVRTAALTDESGNLITADAYQDQVISVKGFVDYYDGNYQIKVFNASDITIENS